MLFSTEFARKKLPPHCNRVLQAAASAVCQSPGIPEQALHLGWFVFASVFLWYRFIRFRECFRIFFSKSLLMSGSDSPDSCCRNWHTPRKGRLPRPSLLPRSPPPATICHLLFSASAAARLEAPAPSSILTVRHVAGGAFAASGCLISWQRRAFLAPGNRFFPQFDVSRLRLARRFRHHHRACAESQSARHAQPSWPCLSLDASGSEGVHRTDRRMPLEPDLCDCQRLPVRLRFWFAIFLNSVAERACPITKPLIFASSALR